MVEIREINALNLQLGEYFRMKLLQLTGCGWSGTMNAEYLSDMMMLVVVVLECD